MSDLNKKFSSIYSLREKIRQELMQLSDMCAKTSGELNKNFRVSFVNRKGSLDGLEDLYIVNNIMKKNAMYVRNALAMINRIRTTDGYEVPEDAENNAELEEIFKE